MKTKQKTLLEEVRALEMQALRIDTPDISSRVKDAASKYGCSAGLALRLLAAKRLAVLQREDEITEEEIEARFRQARLAPDSEDF